jgi:hypothetical protein
MAIVVAQPYKMFFDRDGNPLENGYIYVGIENLNAETNPLAIYWDEALTLAGAQPIRTLAGYPVRNGTPANIFVPADYSITVRDKNMALVYSSPNGSLIADDFGAAIHNAPSDATPDDADEVPMWDTATGALGKFTIANLIAKLAALTTTWGLSTTGNAATANTASVCTGNSVTATTATTALTVTGVTDGSNAAAGKVGEYIESVIVEGSAVSLTSTVFANITSIALTAGDWDITGTVVFKTAATTSVTQMLVNSSTVSAGADGQYGNDYLTAAIVPGVYNIRIPTDTRRRSVAAPTTIYLNCYAIFTVSTCVAYGAIRARRVR